MNHDRAVVQMMINLERRADHRDYRQLTGGFDHGGDCVEAGVEQGTLLKQVVARVGGQAQFGEQREDGFAIGGVANERDGVFAIVGGIGDANGRNSNRDSHEIVIVEIEKVAVAGHVGALALLPRLCRL